MKDNFYYRSIPIIILYVLFSFSIRAQEQIRVEPPFWWTEMTNPQLQLLVHGKDVSTLNVTLVHEGVSIERITKVKNPNYLFMDLNVSEDAKPGKFAIDFKDEKQKVVYSYDYELMQRREGSRQREGFTTKDVIYLITPDRFVNGDPGNDEVDGMADKISREDPFGRHGGDIQGIIDKLDYLSDFGVTSLWLNPVLENNMPSYSYHGYAITDFYKTDPRYGSNELYKELSAKAKEKGIKIIMDVVVNHCGSEHWWMKDLPTDDWTNFNNSFVSTNHKKPSIQDPYGSDYDLKHFVDGWFVESMPDMNQNNPFMATYHIQNAIWWIEYADLGGIRQDTWPYADKTFLTNWAKTIMEEYPNFNITGEEWNGDPNIVSYWQRGKHNHDGYVSYSPSMLDFPIQTALWSAMKEEENNWNGMVRMYEMLSKDYLYADPNNLVTFVDNHDMDRFYTAVEEDIHEFRNGIAYILTVRGIPQLYYGDELLFTNAKPGDHGLIRKDYLGGWDDDQVNAFTGEGLNEQQKETRDFMSKILNWRKTSDAIHRGKLKHFAPYDKVYVYFRMTDAEKVMVIINRNNADIELDISRLQEVLEGAKSGKDIISGNIINFSSKLSLPANDPMIIEIND